MLIIEVLNNIPFGVAMVLATIGIVPFVMSLKRPPQGVTQLSLYAVVYVTGAVGMMSLLSQFVLAAA